VSARERKVATRLAEIARDRRALRNALDRFAGAADFAAVWASEDPDEIHRRDQVERPYERIINDLRGSAGSPWRGDLRAGSRAAEGAAAGGRRDRPLDRAGCGRREGHELARLVQ
jgi:hypothetical protein